MTDQSEPTPAVWDPTARDGAGGWVRRPAATPTTPAEPATSTAPAAPTPYATPARPATPPPAAPPTAPSAAQGFPPPPALPPQQPYARAKRSPLLLAVGVLLLLAVGGGAVLALQAADGSGHPQAQPAPPTSAPAQPPAATPSGSAAPSSSPSSSPSATPIGDPSAGATPGPNAKAQAQALNKLLTGYQAAKVGSEVAIVGGCPDKSTVDAATQVFTADAAQRATLLAGLAKLSFSDLPGGADAAQTLQTAWQQSEALDQSYGAWAQAISATGCSGAHSAPSTPDKQKADALYPLATQSMQSFVSTWNELTVAYGLDPLHADGL